MKLLKRIPGTLVLGPTAYGEWTISAPWQSRICGPFVADIYLTADGGRNAVPISGRTPEAAHDAAVAYIDGQ